MRRRRDVSLTVAVCVSLLAHGGVAWTLIEGQVRAARGRIAQPPLDRTLFAAGPILVGEEERERLAPAMVKTPAEEKLPELEETELTPLPVVKPEPTMLKSVFGESEGAGESANSSEGEDALRAKKAAPEVQAFLSRDPNGPGRVGEEPSMSRAAVGDGGRGEPGPMRKAAEAVQQAPSLLALRSTVEPRAEAQGLAGNPNAPRVAEGAAQVKRPAAEQVNDRPEPEVPFGVPSEKVEAVAPRVARKVPEPVAMIAAANPAGLRPAEGKEGGRDSADVEEREAKRETQAPPPVKPAGAPPTPAPSAKPALIPPVLASATPPQQPAVVKQVEGGGRPGRSTPAADPARMSESESDAFGKVANVEFSDGRVEAQFGRRIRTVRPKLLLSARYEILSLENPRVLLSAKVDATGRVTKVDIYQSSGTPDLDQPCLVAVYDWWFEPPKDKDGKPAADVVVVAITFRNK
jgi:TonB family protein